MEAEVFAVTEVVELLGHRDVRTNDDFYARLNRGRRGVYTPWTATEGCGQGAQRIFSPPRMV